MKRQLFTSLNLGLGIIAALLVAEGAVRFFHVALPKFTYGSYQFPCYTKTPDFWIALKANARCLLHSNSQAFPDQEIKTNNFGLRNPEFAVPKPVGATRILFIGDSFTFGFGVPEESTFPRVVERLLRQQLPSRKLQTINAGLPAVGSGRYYLRFKTKSYAEDADIVVIGLYLYNDIHDEEFKPHWLDANIDELPEKIVSTTAHIDRAGNLVDNDVPWYLDAPVLKQLLLFKLLTPWYLRLKQFGQPNKSPLIAKILCLYKSNCHDFDREKEQNKKVFVAMQQIAVARHQKLLFVMIPAEFQIYDLARFKFDILVPLSPNEKQLPNQEFGAFFAEHGIEYLDLLPVFAEHKEPTTYFEKDEHWNEAGHQLAAEAISQKLIQLLSP